MAKVAKKVAEQIESAVNTIAVYSVIIARKIDGNASRENLRLMMNAHDEAVQVLRDITGREVTRKYYE